MLKKKGKSLRFLLVLPVLIILFFIYAKAGTEPVKDMAQAANWEAMFAKQASIEHDTQSIMIKFLPQTPKSVKDGIVKMLGGSYKDDNGDGIDDRYGNFADGCWMKVTINETNKNYSADAAFDSLSMLQGNSNISFAHFNFKVRMNGTPNDTRFGELWAMNQANDCDIDAPEAWDITTGSEDVVVGIIDTGIDYNHEDLAANVWTNPNEIAGNNIDDDNNGYVDDIHGINAITGTGNPMDDNDHGTHCAGLIGAVGNNGKGVAGVNWKVKMIGMKFIMSNGYCDISDAIACIDYAIGLKRKGINLRVLSNSWGFSVAPQALHDFVGETNNVGILFVAAAANGGPDYIGDDNDKTPNYPSNCDSPNVLAVAATTNTDGLASYSNYGATTVDMGAPGGNGSGGNDSKINILSTTRNNTYNSKYGTSMATPLVAGAAALLLAKNNALTVENLKRCLMNHGDSISSLSGKCVSGKRLNLKKSLDAIIIAPPSVTVEVPNGGELWTCGTIHSIQYNMFPDSNVKIELLRDEALDRLIIYSTPGELGFYDWTIPSDQAPGSDYKIRITNWYNNTTDSSDANFSIIGGGLPDVVITDVWLDPVDPLPGQNVNVWATIKNRGTAPTPSGVVVAAGFRVDGNVLGAFFVRTNGVDRPLAAGESYTAACEAQWTATAGEHTFWVMADDVNRFPESNEDNNVMDRSFGNPLPIMVITATAGPGGTISPAGTVAVIQGNNKTFTIVANSEYRVQSVAVDGVNQGAITSYTFPNVQTDHTIAATFALAQIGVTVTSPNGGETSPNGGESWTLGTTQAITWAATNYSGTVNLVLYNGGAKVGTIVTGLSAATGTYSWTVGQYTGGTAPAGSTYRILVRSADNTLRDFSDAAFTLLTQ